jgi:hypothetical protein
MFRTTANHLLVALAAVAMLAFLTPRAQAQGTQTRERTTFITFSQPVSLPGITLPAGTYLFRHLPPDIVSHRHVVQVLSKDRSKIYATLLTIPNHQLKPAGKPFVMFKETPASAPAAVQAWFYPGDMIGDEFVYPPAQARQIAEANHEPVLSSPAVHEPGQSGNAANANTEANTAQEEKELDQAQVSREGQNGTTANPERQMAENQNTAPATQPRSNASTEPSTGQSAAPSNPATSNANQPPTPTPNPTPNTRANRSPRHGQRATPGTPQRLPQTGSTIWLFGLIAIAAPIGAFGLRLLRSQL